MFILCASLSSWCCNNCTNLSDNTLFFSFETLPKLFRCLCTILYECVHARSNSASVNFCKDSKLRRSDLCATSASKLPSQNLENHFWTILTFFFVYKIECFENYNLLLLKLRLIDGKSKKIFVINVCVAKKK